MPHATAFAYKVSIHLRFRADALSVRKVGRSGGADEDVEDSAKESSEENDDDIPERSDFNLETRSNADEKMKQSEKEVSWLVADQ